MEFIKPGTHFDFIGRRNIAFILSGLLIVATIIFLFYRGGLNLGVDFAGGIQIRTTMEQMQTPQRIKEALRPLQLDDSIIQELGHQTKSEYILKIPAQNETPASLKSKIEGALSSVFGETFRITRHKDPNDPSHVSFKVIFDNAHKTESVQAALQSPSFEGVIIEDKGQIQEFQYLIRVQKTDLKLDDLGEETKQNLTREFGSNKVLNLEDLSEKVNQALALEFGEGLEIDQVEMVGPKVGKELGQKASFAILFAMLFIAIYISGRFELKWIMSLIMAVSLALVVYFASSLGLSVIILSIVALIAAILLCWILKLKYAMGAILALIHDVTITIGAFVLTDREISLPVIAAFLTIIGYSLNDTIVVFDRIRENLKRFRRKNFPDIINSSINETLSRTILTAATTFVVVLALYIFGVNITNDFAFAMIIGIVVGTYSSIFIASPILYDTVKKLEKRNSKKLGKKE